MLETTDFVVRSYVRHFRALTRFWRKSWPADFQPPPLPRLREPEIDLRRRRIRPAGGDHLRSCVEVDSLGTVDVAVAEERVLPAAERVVRHGDGDRDVDTHHSGLHLE